MPDISVCFTAGEKLDAGNLVYFSSDGKVYKQRYTDTDRERGFMILDSFATGESQIFPIDSVALRVMANLPLTWSDVEIASRACVPESSNA